MGDRDHLIAREHARRGRDMNVIYAVMACLLFLLVLQFLMLMVSIEAFLAGRHSIATAGTLASGACFAGACWLIRFITAIRRVGSA